jgi:hypothetical protein
MRTFSTVSMLTAVVAAALFSAACLQKEVRHTLYIAPGAVTWSTLETDVRSDDKDAGPRHIEEQDFALAAGAGRHPVAQALRRLGPSSVTTTWLRRERPYSLMTEARFTDLRSMAAAVLREAQAPGEARLVREGCRVTFTMRVDVDSPAGKGEDGLDALIGAADDYRLVLTEGRFVSADGFTVERDGTVAVPDAKKEPSGGALTLGLVWDEGTCATRSRP